MREDNFILSNIIKSMTDVKWLLSETNVSLSLIKIKSHHYILSLVLISFLFAVKWTAWYIQQRNTEGRCIHILESSTSYNDNSETRRRRSPRTLCPIREELRRKICVWCLILHPVGFSRRQQENREMEGNKTRRKEKAFEGVWTRMVFPQFFRILITASPLPSATPLPTFTISTILHKVIIIVVLWMVAKIRCLSH